VTFSKPRFSSQNSKLLGTLTSSCTKWTYYSSLKDNIYINNTSQQAKCYSSCNNSTNWKGSFL